LVNEISIYSDAGQKNIKKYVCLSLRLSVRMQKLGSHSMDFRVICCFSIFPKSVEKIQVSLNSDKNNWHFT